MIVKETKALLTQSIILSNITRIIRAYVCIVRYQKKSVSAVFPGFIWSLGIFWYLLSEIVYHVLDTSNCSFAGFLHS